MSYHIAKAVKQRSNYILDKYQLGIDCSACEYNYEELVQLDFIKDCFDVCIPSQESQESSVPIQTLDCSLTLEDIPLPACSEPTITSCITFRTIEVNNLELDDYVTSSVAALDFITMYLKSIKVNGQYVFIESGDSADKFILLTTATIDTNSFGQYQAHITAINSYQDTIQLSVGSQKNRIQIRYPEGSTFEIRTGYNEFFDAPAKGVIITQNGLQGLQIAANGPYLNPLFLGAGYEDWEPYYEVVNTESVC